MAYGAGYPGGYGDGYGTAPASLVEVAWTSNPADASPVWVDVTVAAGVNRLRQLTVRRGRQRELDQYAAGRASFTLSNADRAFDPNYTAGPYYGYLLPMKRIRCRSVYNGVVYPIFDGYIDSIDQDYTNPRDATATISATDAFKVLANVDLPASVWDLEVKADLPGRRWRLGEPSGATVAFDQSVVPINGTYVNGVTLGTAGAPIDDADTAATFDGVDDYVTFGSSPVIVLFPYTLELWLKISDRTGQLGSWVFFSQAPNPIAGSGSTPKGWVTGSDVGDPGKLVWDSITSTVRVDDSAWHHVVLTAQSAAAGQQTLYIDGVSQGTGTASALRGNELLLGHPDYQSAAFSWHYWVGSLDEFAYYSYVITAARVLAHNSAGRTPWTGDTPGTRLGRILDYAGWPSGQRSIDTGSSTLQAATLDTSLLDHAQLVERSEFGALFITADGTIRFLGRTGLINQTSLNTFGDSTGELPYADIKVDYSDQLIRNDVQVSRTGGIVQRTTDSTSVTSFYRQGYQRTGLVHDSDQLSKDAADFLVSEYKNPLQRFTGITVRPSRAPTTLFPAVLAVELANRITVNRRPQAVGTVISQVSAVEGISHRFDASKNQWETQFNVSPALTGAFLQLDLTSGAGLDSLRLYF